MASKIGPTEETAVASPATGEVAQAADAEGGQRASWGGKAEFLLTCIGYAVGLGNVWRFPYLCYRNGGGAFIIPYLIALVLVGLPIFFFELTFGQFASLGPFAIWKVNPLFKGVGYGMVAVSWLIALSYNIIISWCVYYLFASMASPLPWVDCANAWNNVTTCIEGDLLKNVTRDEELLNRTLTDRGLTSEDNFTSPSEEFFFNQVLKVSGGIEESGGVVWQLALTLLIVWAVNFLVLIKGIASLGKVVYFATIFPYIMMTIMLIRGATLPGALEGVKYYMTPDWDRLQDGTVWSDAATQIFYSLSACSGGLIAMASYNQFKNNALRDSLIVPFINCGTSLFAGFAIFSVLGFMAGEKNTTVDKVAVGGPGLVFVVYPEGLTQMPAPTVWAILFFIMMVTLGFSSSFSIVETIFVAIMDEFPAVFQGKPRAPMIFRGVCCLIFYLLSLPMITNGGYYLFNLVDAFVSGFPLLFIGIFELVAVQWVYGCRRYLDDVLMMLTGKRPRDLMFFVVCWVGITPAFLLAIVIFKGIEQKPFSLDGKVYPAWTQAIGWLIVTFTLIWIPVVMIIMAIKERSIKRAARPTKDWGPAHPEDRTGRYAEDDLRLATVSAKVSPTDSPPAYTEALTEKQGLDNSGYEAEAHL